MMASGDSPWEDTSELWRGIIESIPDGISIVDAEGVQREVNRALCEITGFSRQEMIGGRAPFCYWPEELHEKLFGVFRRALAGDMTDFELTFRRKNGERFPVLVHPASVKSNGRIVAYVATIKDISERKRMEEALRESEERWRSVAENPFDFVVIIDPDYKFRYVNHTVPGVDENDLIGKATPFDFVDPDHHEAMRSAFETVFSDGQASTYEVYVPLTRTWYASLVGPIFEHGEVTSASILTRDVTRQKQTEQALRQAQRMETLGRFASGIAHDFNNLLVPIMGNAGLALSRLPPDTDLTEYLQDVVQAATRARELVSRILLFGRPTKEEYEAVRVQDVAQEVVGFIGAATPSTIHVETDIDTKSPPIQALQVEIHQIITNLCANAVKALETRGGTITVSVKPGVLHLPTGNDSESSRRAAVCITVGDDGDGIPPGDLSRIFDPFFTTRRDGEGTGLGLSIVHAIATRLGGTVHAESEPGKGARFEVTLPTGASASPVSENSPPVRSAP